MQPSGHHHPNIGRPINNIGEMRWKCDGCKRYFMCSFSTFPVHYSSCCLESHFTIATTQDGIRSYRHCICKEKAIIHFLFCCLSSLTLRVFTEYRRSVVNPIARKFKAICTVVTPLLDFIRCCHTVLKYRVHQNVIHLSVTKQLIPPAHFYISTHSVMSEISL